MIDQIRRVAELREKVGQYQEAKKNSLALWELDNKAILNSLANWQFDLNEAEAALRASAVAEFQATGNKAPAPGVAIRIMTKLVYAPTQALEWAIEHRVALKLDIPTFEKIAKASPIEGVVTISEEPQATISQNLEKILLDIDK